jgi:hypothetical protein
MKCGVATSWHDIRALYLGRDAELLAALTSVPNCNYTTMEVKAGTYARGLADSRFVLASEQTAPVTLIYISDFNLEVLYVRVMSSCWVT